MTDRYQSETLSALQPPGEMPDDPAYWAAHEAESDLIPDCMGFAPEASHSIDASNEARGGADATHGPIPPERPAKLPLFRELEAGEPYPVDSLPPIMRDAVLAIADKTQCDPAIAAGSVLAAASLAVMAHADVVTPHGQVVPTNLYVVTLAESGDRKSAADDLAMRAVRDAEAAAQEKRRAAWGDYCCAKDAWQAAKTEVMRVHKKDRAKVEAALKALGSEPRPPLEPSIVVTEPTIAGLEKAFLAARPALGLFSDEGGQMLGGHAMRDESRLHTMGALNNLWQGKPIKRTRAGDGNSIMIGRRLAVHLMIQPGIAPKLLGDPEAISTGLVGRLLVAAPPSRPGERLWREAAPQSDMALSCFNGRLSSLLETWRHHPDDLQQLVPQQLAMTASARVNWITFHDACQERVRPGGEWEAIRAWGEKAPEQAARLAGVLAVMNDLNAAAVDSLSMGQAIRLVEHYGAEVARIAGQPMLDPELRQAAALLDWIKERSLKRIPLSLVYQTGPAAIRSVAPARKACQILEDHGHLQPLPDGMTADGKRHKVAWRVVPD